MDIHQLVYASAAQRMLNPLELKDILTVARRNNARLSVSGILLYHEGSFLQVLEGDESTVRALFTRICADERHDRILELSNLKKPERSFSSWSMGFVNLEGGMLQTLPGRHALSSNGSLEERAGAALQLIEAFRSGQFHRYVLG